MWCQVLQVNCANPIITNTRLACAKSKSMEQNQKPSSSLKHEIKNLKYLILLGRGKKRDYSMRTVNYIDTFNYLCTYNKKGREITVCIVTVESPPIP